MKIKIEKKKFLKLLKQASPFFYKNSVVENGILIEVEKEIVIYSLGDFSIFAKTKEGEITESGSIVVDGQSLLKMISSLPDGEVTLSTTPKLSLKIKTNSAKKINFSLKGFDKEKYLIPPKFKEENSFQIDKKTFKNIIRKNVPFCDSGNGSFVMTGVLFEINKKQLLTISTNFKQLSFVKTKLDNEIKKSAKFIVPSELLGKIKNIVDDDGIVDIFFNSNFVFFKFDNVEIVSKLIEGDFVDWRKVLNLDFANTVEINKKEFKEAVKRVSVLSDEYFISIKLSFEKNVLKLFYSNDEKGEAHEEIQTKGEINNSILLNWNYLLNTLETFDKNVKVSFNKNKMIRLNEDENSKIIIMGMLDIK